MLRRYTTVLIPLSLIALVATACIITRRPPPPGQPVYVEKHKEQKHKEPKKHKDDHDNGRHRGHDKD